MCRQVSLAVLAVALAPVAGLPAFGQDSQPGIQEPEPAVARVTVTNLMKGQILTPAVFFSHNAQAPPLFVPGQPASPELAALAERGYTAGLAGKFRAEQGVLHVTTLAQFVRPTATATVHVQFDADHRLISSASMIEMTNDGFVSLLGAEIPCEGSSTHFVGGWDAGSEANSELCSEIPAPCPVPARPGRCDVRGPEGAVHTHGGIHGCGGFPPQTYAWRHPVAMIRIEPAPDQSPEGALHAACAGNDPAAPGAIEGSDGGEAGTVGTTGGGG